MISWLLWSRLGVFLVELIGRRRSLEVEDEEKDGAADGDETGEDDEVAPERDVSEAPVGNSVAQSDR
jgi:hypothetical protein